MQEHEATRGERRRNLQRVCGEMVAKYLRKTQKADDMRQTDDVAAEMRAALRKSTNGGVIGSIYEIIQRATGKRGREGSAKLADVLGTRSDNAGQVVRGAANVRAEARDYGQRRHQAGAANVAVARDVMHRLWAQPNADRPDGEAVARACEWRTFDAAVQRSQCNKGVGVDGWNAYLLRQAPESMRRAYWVCTTEMIRTATFPPELIQTVGGDASNQE